MLIDAFRSTLTFGKLNGYGFVIDESGDCVFSLQKVNVNFMLGNRLFNRGW